MTGPIPLGVGGFVLAGGRSSRMGTDKALLQLAGKPLVEHAVAKLRRVCADVSILAGEAGVRRGLEFFGPLVFDLHPGTGPIGGVETALAHTRHDLNLIVPVDVPLVPTAFLDSWVRMIAARPRIRVASLKVFGRLQPTFLLIRRETAPFVAEAVARGDYKLMPALERAVRDLAGSEAPMWEKVPYVLSIDEHFRFAGWEPGNGVAGWQVLTGSQKKTQKVWFANVNTPEDLAQVEENVDSMDT